MRISVIQASTRLAQLVRDAEAGEDVILTRRGQAAVRLVAIKPPQDVAARTRFLDEFMMKLKHPAAGPDAAHSQDFLYDQDGLPI